MTQLGQWVTGINVILLSFSMPDGMYERDMSQTTLGIVSYLIQVVGIKEDVLLLGIYVRTS